MLSPTGNGHIFITGNFGGTIDFDPGWDAFYLVAPGYPGNPNCGDIFITELDNSGDFIWAKSVKGDFYDLGISLAVDHFNQVYVAGRFTSRSIAFDNIIFNNPDMNSISELFFGKLDAFVLPADTQNVNYPFKIYPNPAREHLTIEFADDKIFPVEISIFNLLGQVVFAEKEENIVNKKTIDILALATGIYFVELKFDGKKVLQKLVVV